MSSYIWFLRCFFYFLIFAGIAFFSFPVTVFCHTHPVAGEVVNRSQNTDVKRSGTRDLLPATPDMDLFEGDALITDRNGYASILMSDETLVQINRNTVFVLKKVPESAGWFKKANVGAAAYSGGGDSRFRVDKGEAWLRNKNRDVSIHIDTPTVSAGIRGSEINIQIASDKTVTISILEGQVSAKNEFGRIIGNDGEAITVKPGEAPKKKILIRSEDTVQWTVTIPGPLVKYLETAASGPPELSRWIRTRQTIKAERFLEKILVKEPENKDAWTWLALIRLFRGSPSKAMNAVENALALSPGDPAGMIVQSYCYQGLYDLEQAKETLANLLKKKSGNVLALVNLARLQFGTDKIDSAVQTLDRAAQLSRDNPDVISLRGFLSLARHEYDRVESLFNRAIRLDPTSGEAYLGLSIFHMRKGYTALALKEIATAVLLEPRRSVFLSYWGKMLYQIKRFDRSLQVLNLAQELDPNDPTPHLYKSIIYRDLNRSGRAIDELEKAVDLNDNRAVYRSRFLLDKDLAVKNVDLSIVHNQLGLSDWARSKALESVKYDYRNGSAHTYLAGALLEMGDRLRGGSGENLLGMLLQPANINSLSTFQQYTSFFEQPDTTIILESTLGNMNYKGSDQLILGAWPEKNLAWNFTGSSNSSDGWRGTNGEKWCNVNGSVKWDPSPNDGTLLIFSHSRSKRDDRFTRRYEYDAASLPEDFFENESHSIRFGYHRKISTRTDLIFLGKYIRNEPEFLSHSFFRDDDFGMITVAEAHEQTDRRDYSLQLQGVNRFGSHNLIFGSIFEKLHQRTTSDELWDYYLFWQDNYYYIDSSDYLTRARKTDHFYTVYLQDIWNVRPKFTVEFGLYADVMEQGSVYGAPDLNYEMINPRLGFIYKPDDANVFRLAGFRYLVPPLTDRIDPFDIAGVPVYRNNFTGAVSKEVDFTWEHEWEDLYSVTNFYTLETVLKTAFADGSKDKDCSRVTGADQIFNLIAADWAGIAAGYRFMDIDYNSEYAGPRSRKDHQVFLTLTWNLPNGIFGSASQTYRYMDMENHTIYDNERIWTTDLVAGWRFPEKKGEVKLSVENVFDTHFNWIVDDFIFTGKTPARKFQLTLSLIF